METPDCPRCRELEARVLELEAKLRDLEDRLKPPAKRDAKPLAPGPTKTPTGKKPGAQPGHEPHLKTRLPPERVTHFEPLVPKTCTKCAAALPHEPQPHDPEPTIRQVAELPPIAAIVTEYQGHARHCPACGTLNREPIPAAIRDHSIGPNLTAVMAYLAGCQGVSKRGIEEIVETVFGVPVALGTIANLEQQTSAALQPAHQEARRAAAEAPVKNVDETGWKQAGKKRWLWVAATLEAVVFCIHPRRNLDALNHLLGTVRGILISDRWAIYDDWPTEQHQLCWAHIKRNWEKKAERSGPARRLATAWADQQRQVFELWHRFRNKDLSRNQLSDRLVPHVEALGEILHRGCRSRDAGLARFCSRLLDRFPKLWLFVEAEGVEPTNNHAERVQRRAVIWRRRSFGCHSADGCRFVERILSVVETLKLQQRSVLAYLRDAIAAHRAARPAPRLLPATG